MHVRISDVSFLDASHSYVVISYNDAMATVRRVPSMEHQFQLVITRVYEDEDQELLEDEEESMSTCPYMSWSIMNSTRLQLIMNALS
jgi:type III secretory pathway component EscV